MTGRTLYVGFAVLIGLLFIRCHDTVDGPDDPQGDLTHIPYQPVFYNAPVPYGFPALEQPANNPMTNEGIWLGRKLFFDPILSLDSTISCSTCHQAVGSFTDNLKISKGIAGMTNRGSMSLLNVGFHYNGFFWDGKSATLEDQALVPVENSIEMGETWDHVVEKLKDHPDYPKDFRKAFGIENKSDISKELAAMAIAQFERSLMSSGNSKYDRFARGEIFLSEEETTGYLLFFNFDQSLPDAECGHCHNGPLFTSNDYTNNGLQLAQTLQDFGDKGYGMITGDSTDNGKFKIPTLRNLVFSAPYMHDGRFQTIEEVVEHYNSGGKFSPNKNPLVPPLHLTPQQKSDLIAFILTLTDSSFITNPAYQNPF